MATGLVPVSCLFKLNIAICDSTRQKYLVLSKKYASLTFYWVSSHTFYVYFAPCSYKWQYLILKRKETGTGHVAIATSKCVPSGIFCRVQHPCQVSIALLHYWPRYYSFYVSPLYLHNQEPGTTDDVISD